jgi:beta-N-acetylhexosaminidase
LTLREGGRKSARMTARAFITGIAGTALTQAERSFLREAAPWGLILFKRNIETPGQVADLTASFRDTVGRDAAVLVDQEGGRVQRLGPPHWPAYPAGAEFGRLYDHDREGGLAAAWLGARLIASDLKRLGIDVDCVPLADLPTADASPVIGDRAYGNTPGKVAAIAGAIAAGLMAGGVLPVLKHLPGHGRATADSHERLPVVSAERAVLEATDFAAFRPLAGLPLGMTAHVVFSAIDPVAPATTSATMVREVIRDSIGFKGLLMSDDVAMGALSGSIGERTRAVLAAGCDLVLHCNGDMEEMQAVAAEAPPLHADAAIRAEAALRARARPEDFDPVEARKSFAAMVAGGQPYGTRVAS